jgi:hypothetical protein
MRENIPLAPPSTSMLQSCQRLIATLAISRCHRPAVATTSDMPVSGTADLQRDPPPLILA